MSVTPDLRVDVQLNGMLGSYEAVTLARVSLSGYYRMMEPFGTQGVDTSGYGSHGVYVNTPTLNQPGALGDGTSAVRFTAANEEFLNIPDPGSDVHRPPVFSFSAWFYAISVDGYRIILMKSDPGWVNGYGAYVRDGVVSAYVNHFDNHKVSHPISSNTWYHLVGSFDGDTLRMFLNGVEVGTPVTGLTVSHTTTNLRIAGASDGASFVYWDGLIDELELYSSALEEADARESYGMRLAGVWTDITGDVELDGGLHINRGIQGNGPTDCVADGGRLSFTLDNSSYNDGETAGWYSPNHENCRPGWAFDIPVRVSFIYGSPERIHFYGTVRVIDPEPGEYSAQRVRVEAHDLMRDLIDTDIREINIAIDQSEDQVIDAVLDLLPSSMLPDDRDIDAGIDGFPYVFDRIGPDTKMATPIVDAAVSAFGMFAIKGDGTPMFRSRHTRVLGVSLATFEALRDVVIPSTLDSVFRVVRTTVHPKTIDAAATSVLYSLEGTAPEIGPGATLTLWGDYRDTTDNRTLIGGLDRVVPLVSTTDYLGNSQADGLGSDQTASLSIDTSDFATTAKFEITNTSGSTVFLTHLQIRGKRVLDIGAQTLQSGDSSSRRSKPILIDLPLQSDPHVGQSAADYVRQQYGDQRRQITQLEYLANYSETLLAYFMTLEIGDRITVNEPQTGLVNVDAIIQSIDIVVSDALVVVCRYVLAPANQLALWQWGVVGASEWGETTVYAF